MSAPDAILNSTNVALPDTVIRRYNTLVSGVRLYGLDLLGTELSAAGVLATISCSMPYPVGMIVFAGVPPQVRQMIIQWVAVIVAAMHFVMRHWTNKRLHDYFVDSVCFADSFFRKIEDWATMNINGLFFYNLRPHSQNPPVVRDLVKTFKSKYRLPTFHSVTLWDKLLECQ